MPRSDERPLLARVWLRAPARSPGGSARRPLPGGAGAVPRTSLMGVHSAAAASPALCRSSGEAWQPRSTASARSERRGVGATAPSPTRMPVIRPCSSVTAAATPAMARSIARRGLCLIYTAPYRAPSRTGGGGRWIDVNTSLGRSTVRPRPVKNSSSRSVRWPEGPHAVTDAPSTRRTGGMSAEGDARQTLPARVARLRIWTDAKVDAAKASAG